MKYKNFIFDCDGVVLDSNRIKTDAYKELFSDFDADDVERFCEFHRANTGISRFIKIRHFFEKVLQEPSLDDALVHSYIENYGEIVYQRLLDCKYIPGVIGLLKKYEGVAKYIVSGGLETELQGIFRARKIDKFFVSISGSPRTKDEILPSLQLDTDDLTMYFGDSQYDYEMSKKYNCDFIFINGCTELQDWQKFVQNNNIVTYRDFEDPLFNLE